jgi:hypothetical protein
MKDETLSNCTITFINGKGFLETSDKYQDSYFGNDRLMA